MGLSNAERQARWRAKRDAEIEALRKAAVGDGGVKPTKPASTADAALSQAEARWDAERAALQAEIARLKAGPAQAKDGTAKAEPVVTRADLPLSAHKKFDLAVKRMRQQMEAEIRKELHAYYQQALQSQLDTYNENARRYEKIINMHKGVMTRADWNLTRSCAHFDSRNSISHDRLNYVFNLLSGLEGVLVSAKEKPAKPSDLPKTVEELLRRGAEYQAQRRAERKAAAAKRKAAR